MTCQRLAVKYVEKPWGRDSLPDLFPDGAGRRIGEIWFEGPGETHPPLLVKYIFTSERLSIQVHPNDAEGRERGLPGGKEECWYILEAEPDARLGIGTLRPLSGEELRAAALDGSIEALMDWKPVAAGDFFLIPPGTIHAIGAGISLIETQQNVDVTYRLFDYGRGRELHLDDGVKVCHAEPYTRAPVHLAGVAAMDLLDRTNALFVLGLRSWDAGETLTIGTDGPCWFVPLNGHGLIDDQEWAAGECWLLDGPTGLVCQDATRALIAKVE
ncbi:MAG TPA: class I mannose-6-phosphate isomerase [Sphingobium sp.]|uniref:class I mannose-6-phosphate isomerase n=1 Tax=Sphingobium sp. TaxID=1912891 RepID=UPI002ED1EE68